MGRLLVFDCDGVLRDESKSYERCIVETVQHFSRGREAATPEELAESMKDSNDDWERTHKILEKRYGSIDFHVVKDHFQDLYLGKSRDYTGYINDEPWLADNSQLEQLAKLSPLVIVSGAPRDEIEYALKRNNASDYFSRIWGKDDCKGKKDGILKAIGSYSPTVSDVYFCDDRPKPLLQVKNMHNVHSFGILPPQDLLDWQAVLKDAGAIKVFKNVREYCAFLLAKK